MIPGSEQLAKYKNIIMLASANRNTIGRAGETFQQSTTMKTRYGISAARAQKWMYIMPGS